MMRIMGWAWLPDVKTLSKSDEHPYVHIYELDSLRRYPYRFQGHVIEKWIQRPPLEVFQKRKSNNPAISCMYEHIWTYAISKMTLTYSGLRLQLWPRQPIGIFTLSGVWKWGPNPPHGISLDLMGHDYDFMLFS